MLGVVSVVSNWFQASEGSQDIHIFIILTPNPQPGGPGYPILSWSSPWPVWHGRPYQ